ncbi:MAG: ABC transporter ATP-binding protein [Candidatus Pacebacteria bacterium]|nr:ABC transporter ATP-binding protein [Candidatus Paceibacterota bacterium]
MISVKNLKKCFKEGEVTTKVLRGISFDVKKGEFVSIMGPSGSGKSTLMHILGFLDNLTVGKYYFEDEDVSSLSDNQLAKMRNKKVGFVFQSFNLLNRMSVLENVMLPLTYDTFSLEERKEKATKILDQMNLSHRLNYLPNNISGGERQRVAIARALVNDPEVIFADEPTGNLDSKSGFQVMKILQELNDNGNTIILVTHEKVTAEYADRIINIRDGLIIDDSMVTNKQIASKNQELIK